MFDWVEFIVPSARNQCARQTCYGHGIGCLWLLLGARLNSQTLSKMFIMGNLFLISLSITLILLPYITSSNLWPNDRQIRVSGLLDYVCWSRMIRCDNGTSGTGPKLLSYHNHIQQICGKCTYGTLFTVKLVLKKRLLFG